MPEINNREHDYEPSRSIKEIFLTTRKKETVLSGACYPGLFQTASKTGDWLGFLLAVLLEIYGLANLMRVGSVILAAAMALVIADILGALLAHYKQGLLCRIRCEIAVTDSRPEQERLRMKNSLLHQAIRSLGFFLIAGSAVWKMLSFGSIGALNDTPPAIIALVCLCYVTAAVLHMRCTGWALAEAYLEFRIYLERSKTMRQPKDTAICGIHGFRVHRFTSRLNLAEHEVEGHALVKVDGDRYELNTYGLLLDHDVATLAALQPGLEEQAFVAREGLKAQLAMLDQEPIRPSVPGADRQVAVLSPASAAPAGSRNGTIAAEPALRRVANGALMAAVLLNLTGCPAPHRPAKQVLLHVIAPTSIVLPDHTLPLPLVDLLAPESAPNGTSGKGPVMVPKIELDVIGERLADPIEVEPHVDAGFFARSWGVTAPGERLLADTRRQLLELKIAPKPLAPGPEQTVFNSPQLVEKHIESKDGKPHGPIIAFDAQLATPCDIHVGSSSLSVLNDPAQASQAIADAVKKGETDITLLYAAAKMLAPDLLDVHQPAVSRAAPKILSLNSQFTHADLVNGAKARLLVHFAKGSTELRTEYVRAIEDLARAATGPGAAQGGEWIVIGYADGHGQMSENDKLSLDRALRVAAEMGSLGLRVSIVAGAGETRPVSSNENARGRADNRRAQIYWRPFFRGT